MKRIVKCQSDCLVIGHGYGFGCRWCKILLLRQNEDKVTICHAAGLAGTTHYITLTISRNAVFGPGGHFFENGTPQAGHEQDYMGACTTDTTTTDTTDTTTTTTTIDERGVATASALCIRALGEYRVVGTIDGQVATVEPDTIPGNKNGLYTCESYSRY